MPVSLKQVYEKPCPEDGYRVLVDRLWPRGVSKEGARLDQSLKEIAPSEELRKFLHADRSHWSLFRRRYLSELKEHREELRPLAQRAEKQRVTLVYSSSDEASNNETVLKQYLAMLGSG